MRYLRALRRFKKTHNIGEPTGMPLQWKLPEEPKPKENPKRPRDRLLPLKEDVLPYFPYSKEDIDDIQKKPELWDPIYNPIRIKDAVDPDEEPFRSVYATNQCENGTRNIEDQFTKVNNITTPELWRYVERLARVKVAPRPTGQGPLPSGYVPPPAQPPDLPYFIARTRNHILPVYYMLGKDYETSFTYVRYVSGDIWKFEEDLRAHLETLNSTGRRILTSVREPDGSVAFRGKHINAIVDWLHSHGF